MNWMYRTEEAGADVAERAAICIQKVFKKTPNIRLSVSGFSFILKVLAGCHVQVWRGFVQRKKTKIARKEEMIFLGMVSKMCQSG